MLITKVVNTGFLQSEEWRKFQEAVGRLAVHIEGEGYQGNGFLHELPLVGKYLYFPRGPLVNTKYQISNTKLCEELEKLGKQEKARWIRIEPRAEELRDYQKFFGNKLVKAPHDVQPREVLVMDIAPEEDALLQKMKSKTRYNIRLAEKKGVKVFTTREKKYEEAFLDLMTRTATRKEITPHPQSHYAHFFSSLPPEHLFLFVAEYQGKVLAANLLVLFGDTATYLHGGSSDEYRDMMAPYFLQWEQIRFAKSRGMKYYDFGGVSTQNTKYQIPNTKSWAGITRFKQGFAPEIAAVEFPGTYDIVLDLFRYRLYRMLSPVQSAWTNLRKKL